MGLRKPAVKHGAGQVIVEMILVLPIFLALVFSIMEVGYLDYWVILLNHATYECARIGALEAYQPGSQPPLRDVTSIMQNEMDKMIPGAVVNPNNVPIAGYQSQPSTKPTLLDPQSNLQNQELIVTAGYSVPLIFPTSYFLLAVPRGSGHRYIVATVYMPIEQPLTQ